MKITVSSLCAAVLLLAPAIRAAGTDAQTIMFNRATEVPGTTFSAGAVRFEVEDRLQDRAIVRVTAQDGSTHELVLSVPNEKIAVSGSDNLVFFAGGDATKQAVQAWKCASCSAPLEFIYPKDQAVALTQSTGKPVMAIDPTYDKLPANLSPDDMKVVTLWLLSPKQVSADGKGSGVEPTKYADLKAKEPIASAAPVASSAPAAVAATPASASTPASPEPVQGTQTPKTPKMPHTASNTSEFALTGLLLLGLSAGFAMRRKSI